MEKTTPAAFENAMFGGIDHVLKYYEPYIISLGARHEDRSRATLNHHDIEQHCRVAIYNCWKKQIVQVNIKNFDMMVKRAMQNIIQTMIGKEYCRKRGRCTLEFFSEMKAPGFEDNSDHENLLYRRSVASSYEQEGDFGGMLEEIDKHLDCEQLQRTFRGIVLNHPFEHLNAQNLTPKDRTFIAEDLNITQQQLVDDLYGIQFILAGFRVNFLK